MLLNLNGKCAVTYVILVIGLAKDDDSSLPRVLQVAGIMGSLISVSKTAAEWHLFTAYNADDDEDRQIPPNIIATLKALLFFVPHVVFRTISIAFVAAFLKFYSLIPLTVYFVINSAITCFLHNKQDDAAVAGTSISFATSLFTPSVTGPRKKSRRSLLKSTMLSSTLTLLPSLVLIRFLPFLSPETISCSWGLSHLNHSSPIPDCSPCFNLTATNSTGESTPLQTNSGPPCVMAITLDDFSVYFFWPLLVLGVWCLFEGGIYLIPKLAFLFPQRLQSCARRRPGLFPIGGRRCRGSCR